MSNYIFESVIIHSVLIFAYWVFLSRENQYFKMRIYLLGSTLLAIVIPLFRLPKLFYNQQQTVQELPAEFITTISPTVLVTADVALNTIDSILLFSFLISCLFIFRLSARIIYLFRLESRSTSESYHGLQLKNVSNINGSFTFFNWIFLGDDVDKSHKEFDTILKHEEAHVNLKHSYDLVFFELFKAIFWYLPSSWYINREIKHIHEYQADACVIQSVNIDLYSSILIKNTLQSNGLNLASSFHDGLIFKRLNVMKQQVKKVSRWKFGLLTSLSAFLFVSFACTEDRANVSNPIDGIEKAKVQRDIFTKVEDQPSYTGGMDAFYSYVISNMRYPLKARQSGVEGAVHIQFDIERDGAVSNVSVVNGIGSGCDQEAVKVIKQASGFIAGSQRGRTVSVTMQMPISFALIPEKRNPDNSIQGTIVAGKLVSQNKELNLKAEYTKGAWSGTVLSAEGKKLAGVNIVVADTSYGTVSDLDGTFSVKTERDQALHISYVGYKDVVLKEQ